MFRPSPANNNPQLGLRRLFLVVPLAYLLVLLFVAVQRSSARTSVLEASAGAHTSSGAVSDQLGAVSSRVQLDQFHRVEIKEGRPVWEISAKDAKYYPREFVTHVNEAKLKIFRDKEGDIEVRSAAARLYLGGTALTRAVLDGDIKITIENGMKVSTQSAEFDAAARVFSAPGEVSVSGDGFDVSGNEFRFDVEQGLFTFANNVRCVFNSGASVPKDLTRGVLGKDSK